MVAHVSTVAYLGLEARAVEVQVQLAPGVPAFAVVGLADKAVAESRERVRAALTAIGLVAGQKFGTLIRIEVGARIVELMSRAMRLQRWLLRAAPALPVVGMRPAR